MRKVTGIGIHNNQNTTFQITTEGEGVDLYIDKKKSVINNNNYIYNNRCSAIKIYDNIILTPEHLFGSLALLNNFNISIHANEGFSEFPVGPENDDSYFYSLYDIKKESVFSKDVINNNFTLEEDKRRYIVEPSDTFECVITQKFINNERYEVGFSLCDLQNNEYINEISKSRTWIYKNKIDDFIKRGICLGYKSKWCAIVDYDELESDKLRRELALHKLLDLLGDLYIIGYWPNVKLTIENPNHRLNNILRNELMNN